MNYDYPTKRHARRTYINALIGLLAVPSREALGLYLPGPTDEEGDLLIQKGFDRARCIGVERSARVASLLRKKHIPVISGDVFDILDSIDFPRPINFLSLDFVCGLELRLVKRLTRTLKRPAFSECVIGLNLQRGRDKSTNNLRRRLLEGLAMQGAHFDICHRVFGFTLFLQLDLIRAIQSDFSELQLDAALASFHNRMQVKFGSYRSRSGPYFDWGVFRNPFGFIYQNPNPPVAIVNEAFRKDVTAHPKLRRQFAAIRAHVSRGTYR